MWNGMWNGEEYTKSKTGALSDSNFLTERGCKRVTGYLGNVSLSNTNGKTMFMLPTRQLEREAYTMSICLSVLFWHQYPKTLNLLHMPMTCIHSTLNNLASYQSYFKLLSRYQLISEAIIGTFPNTRSIWYHICTSESECTKSHSPNSRRQQIKDSKML